MTTWTSDELDRIGVAEELVMAPFRSDGTPRGAVPVWVVRDGGEVYVRSFRGTDGGWWRAARASRAGRVSCDGIDRDVTLAEVTDTEVNDRVDTAYRAKYGRFGAAYVDPLVAARATTLRLVPR